MDLPEEYTRCHCGRELETYEHFMGCERYKGIVEPLVRDQDVPLLQKGGKGRRAMERVLGKEGHRKGLWHMVIVKSLWRGLQEHTVAPEAVAHRLLRRIVEHLQEAICVQGGAIGGTAGRHERSGHQTGGDGDGQVKPANHRDGSATTARLAATAVGGRAG